MSSTSLSFMDRLQPRIESELRRWLPQATDTHPILQEAIAYSVLNGGKRLRPMMTLLACELVSDDDAPALPAACALEMIHCYSLVHDDLPCMDDDDLRRGKPTVHRVFGEAMAVLAGDALQAQAFAVISDPGAGYDADTVRHMIRELAVGAGPLGMVGGQADDITGGADSLEALAALHRKKTGALFRAAVRLGGWAGGATPFQLGQLTQYAEAFGLAFQIMDDVLDVVGDPEKTGRYKGSDAQAGRLTYPALLGLDESRDMAEITLAQGIKALEPFDGSTEELRELLEFVVTREG